MRIVKKSYTSTYMYFECLIYKFITVETGFIRIILKNDENSKEEENLNIETKFI